MFEEAIHLTEEQKISQQSYYTPEDISLNLAKMIKWVKGKTILDPSCGRGNLLQACKQVYPELTNGLLYGIDIDPEAIRICKERFPGGHFVCADFLKVDPCNDDLWNDTENYLKRKGLKSKFRIANNN